MNLYRSDSNSLSLLCSAFLLVGLTSRSVSGHSEAPQNCAFCDADSNSSCFKRDGTAFSVNDFKILFHRSNSYICSDNNFTGDIDAGKDFSSFSLLTSLKKTGSISISVFNMTFSKIKWTSMIMRLKKLDPSEEVDFCLEFKVRLNNNPDFCFHINYTWFDWRNQNWPYTFEYLISSESGYNYIYKYLFNVPDNFNMDYTKSYVNAWDVFSMLDISDVATKLTLLVQALPVSLNVTTYIIEVTHQYKGENETEVHTEHHNPYQPLFEYTYLTKSRPGTYRFRLAFEHPDCDWRCNVSNSLSVLILESEGILKWLPLDDSTIVANVFIVIFSILLMVILAIKYISTNPDQNVSSSLPKFLMIYNPVSEEHIKAMEYVASYLNNECRLHVLIDLFGIPLSVHQDPIKWYIEAFNEADNVGVFSSPKSYSTKDLFVKTRVYRNTYTIALALLQQRMCFGDGKCNFFSIALPNTCWDTLPVEAQAIKRYRLPHDFNSFFKKIGVAPPRNPSKKFLKSLGSTESDHRTVVITFKHTENIPDEKVTLSQSAVPVPMVLCNTCCTDLRISD